MPSEARLIKLYLLIHVKDFTKDFNKDFIKDFTKGFTMDFTNFYGFAKKVVQKNQFDGTGGRMDGWTVPKSVL